MAEIKIEKKAPIWPWILAGLVILGLVLYFFVFDKNANQAVVDDADTTEVVANEQSKNDAVAQYLAFMDRDTAGMTLDHHYSNEALTKLANATEEMGNKVGEDVSAEAAKARELANRITNDENSTTHADDIKTAGMGLSMALQKIQQKKFADLSSETNEVVEDAKEIDARNLTLDQKNSVKDFYKSAADLLKKMNDSYTTN